MEHTPEESGPRLPPGTQVGNWRVVAWQGQGAYGAVYRAVRIGQEHEGPVALKLALYPWDARFAREAELLARLRHPNIPRLLDRGLLRHASGAEHPFFIMEWVDGTPLYSWAQQHAPSHRQMCQLLAQLARALQALHATGAVHRDVKGDNVLVRHSDGQAVLIDFGSGHFQGATRLTWQSLAPGTPAYQSAQACLFHIRSVRERDSYYPPSPADDLFALGVTAYRLLMGHYPPPMDVQQDEEGTWHVKSPDPRPLLESNPRLPPLLRQWLLRLLSDAPEARGTAALLAQALETVAGEDVPGPQPALPPAAGASPPNASPPVGGGELPQRPSPSPRSRSWKPWLVLAAAAGAALLLWSLPPVPAHLSASAPRASGSHVPDAGSAAVGDASPTSPLASAPPPSKKEPIAQEPPAEPPPAQSRRQARPDKKGRCPGRMQVVIDGACWAENPSMSAEVCAENGYVLLKGKCYGPALEPLQKPLPTSSPAKAR
jgi:serine/threonine protein kinase